MIRKEYLEARRIALETWTLIAPFYDAQVDPEIKADGSPVTIADKTANEYILSELRKTFPKDTIVSEEAENEIRGKRSWHIDPIDGTKGFIKRNGHFAIHIGFCEGNVPTLGVVYAPAQGEMYFGGKGHGAWRENARGIVELRVNPLPEKGLVAVVNGDNPPEKIQRLLREVGVEAYHNSGSEGLRLMKIAEGRSYLRVSEKEYMLKSWDMCAPQAIVEGAGGIFSHMDGKPIHYDETGNVGTRYVVTTDKRLHQRVLEAYAKEESNA